MAFSLERGAGARVLMEVEEENLDEVFTSFRNALPWIPTTSTSRDGAPQRRRALQAHAIPELDVLMARNLRNSQSACLELTGRYLALLYRLVAALVSAPNHKAVVVVDIENRFDTTRLQADVGDLDHVHVYRPSRCTPDGLRQVIAEAEAWMLYGRHESRSREWWGVVFIGSPSSPSDTPAATTTTASNHIARVMASWKGWMRVDSEGVDLFHPGSSICEALCDRDRRQAVVGERGWSARCEHGVFDWKSI